MTIPKSYEALAADLASEKILSKTLLGQKEAYMKLADKGGLDLSESQAREAVLREELDKWQGIAARRTGERTEFINERDDARNERDALQQRLTVSEQRADDLESLVRDVEPMVAKKHSSPWFAKRYAALKPAAEGEGS